MNKPPAFQFYPADWIAGTAHMTLAEQGAYARLLAHQWMEGSVPNYASDRARILGVSGKAMKAIWRRLEKHFPPTTDPQLLANPRLEHERTKQEEYRLLQAQHGRKGGRPRRPLAEPLRNDKGSLTSSSSSSSSGTATQANACEDEPRHPLQLPEQPPAPESVGAFYGRLLKPILKPPNRAQESRDISVLKRQLRGVDREDVLSAVLEVRAEAEAGRLEGWIAKGESFGLVALVADSNGGIATFERFRHAAVKRRENGDGT